ncbi:unnamed protein product [Rhizophagus irregularis]|nr:unnamed protein product [Rhizophagus irregularis]
MVRLLSGLPKYRKTKFRSAVQMGFQSIETPKIHSAIPVGFRSSAVRMGFQSIETPKIRKFGRSGGLPKIGCSEERENSKIRSGGLPCSEEQENSKDSIWWASEERKTKKPRFISLGFGFGWIGFDFGLWAFDSIGCDILGLWICRALDRFPL